MERLPDSSTDPLPIRHFEQMLDYDYLTTSYKLYWFLGVFKEILDGNQMINFRRVALRMLASSWYPIIQFKLNFGKMDMLADLANYIHKTYSIASDVKEIDLINFIDSLRDARVDSSIDKLTNYVPYRLMTPFFSQELARQRDSLKNRMICDLSSKTDTAFYKIIKDDKLIVVNDAWMYYVVQNQNIIFGWLNYKLIYYLQKKNPSVPAIPFKIRPPYKRDLVGAGKFWEEIIEETHITDVYTDLQFNSDSMSSLGGISVDHFLPWSFVLHDEIWNLVPTFKSVNSSKGNRLPQLDSFLNRFCEIQYLAVTTPTHKKHTTLLEDYWTLNNAFSDGRLIPKSKETFITSLKETISPLYQIAYNQGFEVWAGMNN